MRTVTLIPPTSIWVAVVCDPGSCQNWHSEPYGQAPGWSPCLQGRMWVPSSHPTGGRASRSRPTCPRRRGSGSRRSRCALRSPVASRARCLRHWTSSSPCKTKGGCARLGMRHRMCSLPGVANASGRIAPLQLCVQSVCVGGGCDVTGTQGSGIPAGIGADSGKFRLWTGIPGIRDCRGAFRSGGTPGTQDQKHRRHACGFRSWEVRACQGECQEEEVEQVQALRRAVVGHRPVAYPGAHGLHPRMGGPAEVWLMCEAQRPGKLRLAGGVRGVHANTMRVEDAKKAAKLQGGIDHAAVG